MKKENAVRIFEQKLVRTHWDAEKEVWYISVIDVIGVLTGTDRARKYWDDLKSRLKKEGSELSEKIGHLKMLVPDGKMSLTYVADTFVELNCTKVKEISSPSTFQQLLSVNEVEISHSLRFSLLVSVNEKEISPHFSAGAEKLVEMTGALGGQGGNSAALRAALLPPPFFTIRCCHFDRRYAAKRNIAGRSLLHFTAIFFRGEFAAPR